MDSSPVLERTIPLLFTGLLLAGSSMAQITVSPSSLTVCVANGQSATNYVTLQNNTGGTINITQISAATSNWLTGSTGSPYPQTVVAGAEIGISVTTTGTGLSSTTLNDSLVITIQNQPSVSVPVTFKVGMGGPCLSSVRVAFAYPNGTSQQAVAVTGVTAYNATASTTDGHSWFTMMAGFQSGLQLANVPVTTQLTLLLGGAADLPTGNYTGMVIVSDANSSSTATISVTLAVNGGAISIGSTSIIVSPATSVSFVAEVNGIAPPFQTLVLSAPAGPFTATATSDRGWLFLEGGLSGSTIPGLLQVLPLNLQFLTAGTYSGNIQIMAGGLTQNIPVSLTVYAEGMPVAFAEFDALSSTVLLTVQGSGATPSSQEVALSSSDPHNYAVTLSGIQAPSWLTVTQTDSQRLTFTPNVSGLASGLYSGFVLVNVTSTAGTIQNSPLSIPVVLSNNAGTGSAPIITPSQPYTFTISSSGLTPSSVAVSVRAATATSFNVSTPTPWVTILQGTGNFVTPQNLTLTVNPWTLTPSSIPYSGEIDFTANGVSQKYPVSLTVANGSNARTVTAAPQSLNFTVVAGGQKLGLPVTVTSSGASLPFTVAVSVQGAGAWLSSDTKNALTPKQVTITADPTTLTPGTYKGTVTVTASNTVTVPVTFTVQGVPAISAGATNLTFAYLSGGSTPPAQTVLISGSTGGFTATAASDTGNWLSVTPTSGAAGTNISVSVDPTGIAIGSHTGTVTIAGTNGLTGQAVINVSFTITAPLPSVSSVGNGASYAQGTAAPGEVITLFGSNLGPATGV